MSRDVKKSSSPGLPGEIVQLPSEVPWRKTPARPAAESKQRQMLVCDKMVSAVEFSPNLLFEPIESESPDSSEPSALTVVRCRSEQLAEIVIGIWLGFSHDISM